jgi:hypothetical protein
MVGALQQMKKFIEEMSETNRRLEQVPYYHAVIMQDTSVADPHWFHCGSGYRSGSSIFLSTQDRIWIQIQGFDDQKLEKKLQLTKKIYISLIKNCNLLIP